MQLNVGVRLNGVQRASACNDDYAFVGASGTTTNSASRGGQEAGVQTTE